MERLLRFDAARDVRAAGLREAALGFARFARFAASLTFLAGRFVLFFTAFTEVFLAAFFGAFFAACFTAFLGAAAAFAGLSESIPRN
jgi:purine-cytosine permease-like protein